MASELVFLTVPIGNLSDLSKRVLDALTFGKKYIVEDSRVFLSLLNALKIDASQKEMITWHDHSDEHSLKKIKIWLQQKETIYVLSDAGSPILSDPAFDLLQKLGEEHYKLDAYGGVTSVIQALELSLLPPIPFHFQGFLARSDHDIKEQIQTSRLIKGTHLFFISPHRLLESMDVVSNLLPDTKMVLARELTKKFQEIIRFQSDEWKEIKDKVMVKGEFVLLFFIPEKKLQHPLTDKLLSLTQEYLQQPRPKVLAKILAEITGDTVSDMYKKLQSSPREE